MSVSTGFSVSDCEFRVLFSVRVSLGFSVSDCEFRVLSVCDCKLKLLPPTTFPADTLGN